MKPAAYARGFAAALVIGGIALAVPGSLAAQTLVEKVAALPQQQEPTAPADASPSDAATPLQLVGVLHVHSTASSGTLTPARIARQARAAGIDFVLLTENFAYRFRYAPSVLRYFFEATRSTPTIEDKGIAGYLREIQRVQAQDDVPLLLIGVEVPPFYYWTGSLLSGDLKLNDMQRNVLVAAPPEASPPDGDAGVGEASYPVGPTVRLVEAIPAAGNSRHRHVGWKSFFLLVPGLLLLGWPLRRLARDGAFSASTYRASYVLDVHEGRYVRRRRLLAPLRIVALTLLMGTGAALLYFNYPYLTPSVTPYDPPDGYRPFETLFSDVASRGGLVFWSMPEAVDEHEVAVGPVTVRLSTRRYKDALVDTKGYTGFGSVYADTVSTNIPGDVWDQALLQYLRGERASAPWGIGESAFHAPGQAGKQLDDIVTVTLVPERSLGAVFEALAAGHAYASRRDKSTADLRLTEFSLSPTGVRPDEAVARSGDTLTVSGVEFELSLRIDDAGNRNVPVDITVVRHGAVHREIRSTTPFEAAWRETLGEEESPTYYRIMVDGPGVSYVVSNPIFVQRDAGDSNSNGNGNGNGDGDGDGDESMNPSTSR